MFGSHRPASDIPVTADHRDLGAKFFPLSVAVAMLTITPLQAAEFSTPPAHQNRLLHRVAVFSDDPQSVHDPRHPQSQTGADKAFAPIGLFWTGHPVPHQAGATTTLSLDMGTAFLLSPCYIMTNYHVVFGNLNVQPDPKQDYSGTFRVAGKRSHAVPIKWGRFYEDEWRDWALLRLDSDVDHPCVGEDPEIGWVHLAALARDNAPEKPLSTAGYPSDRTASTLWRQDTCHFYEKFSGEQDRGLWTTDCATRPRASGSPIFFLQDGMLMVVALMHGHLGIVNSDEILRKWDPERANLAVDMGDILSSDAGISDLVESDIDRYRLISPEQVVQSDTDRLLQTPVTLPDSNP